MVRWDACPYCGAHIVYCENCKYWEKYDEYTTAGRCRNDEAPCQNQETDAEWYCADGEGKDDD